MKTLCLSCIAVTLTGLFSCNAQTSQNIKDETAKAEIYLKQHPKEQKAWQQLYTIVNDNYTKFSAGERTSIRNSLEQYAIWSTGTLYTVNEPGTKIIIKRRIINKQGKPVANASLHIFQTDSHGYYTPLDSAEKKMGEPDARLFCFLKTDSSGNFEIRTIRPANYPIQYNGRTIPRHIHSNIIAQGYTAKNLQMVFDDDPAMNAYWRKWASDNGFPVLKLDYKQPQPTATLVITL